MPATVTTHTICTRHGRTALVGPGTLLSELECIDCITEQDDATTWRPCCPQMNTTCCGHDDTDPYLFLVVILSPNYCNDEHLNPDDVPF